MNQLVMITVDEDGHTVLKEHLKWCFVDPFGSDPQVFCDGQYFGEGQSECEYKTKEVQRGGITCRKCLDKIRFMKKVRL